jgi:hypothetical protein
LLRWLLLLLLLLLLALPGQGPRTAVANLCAWDLLLLLLLLSLKKERKFYLLHAQHLLQTQQSCCAEDSLYC